MISEKDQTNNCIENIQLTRSCLSKFLLFCVFDYDYNLIALCIAARQKVNSKRL